MKQDSVTHVLTHMCYRCPDCAEFILFAPLAEVCRRLFKILLEQTAKVGGGGEAGAPRYFTQIVFRFTQQLAHPFQSLVLDVIMNACAQPPAKPVLHVRA